MSLRTLLGCFLVPALCLFASPVPARADTIKMGHYGSLTGSQATFGQSTSNGVKLAINEINAAGGINGNTIQLVEYDTKGDPREGGAVVTRLCTNDHVVAVLGEVASSVSLAGADVCQHAGVPMITPSSTNPAVTEKGDYIFRVCFIDPFQGQVGAVFATENLKAKSAAILIDQTSAYSKGLAQSFKENFESLGGKVTIEQSYNQGDADFNPRLIAIRDANPDIIYIPGYYTDVATIAVQTRKLGMAQPLLGGDGWDSNDLAKNAGQAIEGAYFSNHAAPDEPKMVEFAQKYRDEYGTDPDALGALGYDAANVLFDAMKRAKSLNGPDLRDAIAATPGFEGVTGKITFNEKRDTIKAAVIVQIKDGKPVLARRIDPSAK